MRLFRTGGLLLSFSLCIGCGENETVETPAVDPADTATMAPVGAAPGTSPGTPSGPTPGTFKKTPIGVD